MLTGEVRNYLRCDVFVRYVLNNDANGAFDSSSQFVFSIVIDGEDFYEVRQCWWSVHTEKRANAKGW